MRMLHDGGWVWVGERRVGRGRREGVWFVVGENSDRPRDLHEYEGRMHGRIVAKCTGIDSSLAQPRSEAKTT